MKTKHLVIGGIALVGVVAVIAMMRRAKQPISLKGDKWQAPVNGPLTSGFGVRKDPTNPSKTQGHNGQDIAVPLNTPVKDPADGTVISTTSSEAGGNQVVIKHDNGWQTGYAHLNKVLVNKGQRVRTGQVIALSGNTGKHTTGAHLHLTMTNPKGQKVDPKPIIYVQKRA